MTNTAIVRELYWGCGGGVMQCFSSAVTTAVLNEENHPSCRISAPRQNQDMPVGSRKRDRQNRWALRVHDWTAVVFKMLERRLLWSLL